MSEEISKGVEILLKRCETNPQEIVEEYGKWGQLRDAVFNYKERKERSQWLRGLTEHEIDLLFTAFNALYKDVFDTWVLKEILADEEELTASQSGLRFKSINRYSHGWNDPSLLQNVAPHHNTLQNNIQPGGIGYYNAAQSAVSGTATQGATTSVSPKTLWQKLIK